MKGYLKSASSVKTGKKFYESRLAKNYSIDDVAEILYINKDYVRAIESGNFSIFPSKIFAKAYFDKYRKFLGINCQLPDVFDDIESKELKNLKKEVRLPYDWNKKIKCRFICALTIYWPNKKYYQSQGIVKGIISTKPKGKNGFGYDPIFIPNGYKITFGQMLFSKKSKIDQAIESFSVSKAISSMRSSSGVLYLVDGKENITDQDLHLISLIVSSGKPMILGINKSDKLSQYDKSNLTRSINKKLP